MVGCPDVTRLQVAGGRSEQYARLLHEEGLEAIQAGPPPLWMRNFARVVGLSTLAMGLFLILMIGLAVVG